MTDIEQKVIQCAADAYLGTFNPLLDLAQPVVWAQPIGPPPEVPGEAHTITRAFVPDKAVVLRSRRD